MGAIAAAVTNSSAGRGVRAGGAGVAVVVAVVGLVTGFGLLLMARCFGGAAPDEAVGRGAVDPEEVRRGVGLGLGREAAAGDDAEAAAASVGVGGGVGVFGIAAFVGDGLLTTSTSGARHLRFLLGGMVAADRSTTNIPFLLHRR